MFGTVSVSFVFLLGVALYFAAYFLFLRWCARTARKVGRSPVGFVWLGVFVPLIAWIILLTLNKNVKYQA